MKTIIQTAQSELQESLTNFKERNIFITPDLNIFPMEKSFPAIGIKDGKIEHLPYNQDVKSTYTVQYAIYVEIIKEDESSVIGDTSTNKKGTLDIASDLRSVLDDNLLSITGLNSAFCTSESESLLIPGRSRSAMRKILTYQYIKRI